MTELDSSLVIFSALAEFVLERTNKIRGLLSFDTIHSLVEEWRSFIQGRSEKLSTAVQLGLFGELLFLQELISKKNEELGIISWTGPEKSKVDFRTIG